MKDDAVTYVVHLVAYDVMVGHLVENWVPLVHSYAVDVVVVLVVDREDFVVAYVVDLVVAYVNRVVVDVDLAVMDDQVVDVDLVEMDDHPVVDVVLAMDDRAADVALEMDAQVVGVDLVEMDDHLVVDEDLVMDDRVVGVVLEMDDRVVGEDHVVVVAVHEVGRVVLAHEHLNCRDCAVMVMGRGFVMVAPLDLAPEEAAWGYSEEMAMPSSSNQLSVFYPQLQFFKQRIIKKIIDLSQLT